MNEQIPSVPLIILNAAMTDEYREVVVTQVLEQIKVRKANSKPLDVALQKVIVVPGYKHPTKAPLVKVRSVAVKVFKFSPEVIAATLTLWVKFNEELCTRMSDFLQAEGVELQPINYASREFSGFHSAKEELNHIEAFQSKHPDFDESDVRLMYICLRGSFYPPEEFSHLFDDDATPQSKAREAGYVWAEWLEQLQSLPAAAPEWDHLDKFLAAVAVIAVSKIQERQNLHQLSAALVALCETQADQLSFFEFDDCCQWPVEDLSLDQCDPVAESIAELQTALTEYGRIVEQQPANVTERRTQAQRLDQLEAQALQLYKQLQQVFAPAAKTGAGNGKPVKATAKNRKTRETAGSKAKTVKAGPAVAKPDSKVETNDRSSNPPDSAAGPSSSPKNVGQGGTAANRIKNDSTEKPVRRAKTNESGPKPGAPNGGGSTQTAPNVGRSEAHDHEQAQALAELAEMQPVAVEANAGHLVGPKTQTVKTPAAAIAVVAKNGKAGPASKNGVDRPAELTPAPAPPNGEVGPSEIVPTHPLSPAELQRHSESMLSNWLGSWPYLPKAYLLTTWLNQKHPDVAQRFPSPELCELAYYAFQPLKPTGHGSLSKETPPSSDHFELLWHTSQSASDELRVAAWQVVAALVTLHGETALQDLLEFRYGWINQPEFEPWSPLAETLHLFWSQTTTSIPEIGFQLRRHNGQVSHAQALAKVKTEARDAFQMIKKPGINQRLRNHIVREKLDWLPDLLTRALADGQALAWASKFDPDTALVAWADEAGLKPIDPGEPEYRSLIRNLRNLQQAITDWGELALGPQDDPMARTINHLDQLQETITLERENWRSTWAKTRTKWPTLAGWSLLLLRRLEETFEGAGLDNGVGERHGRV